MWYTNHGFGYGFRECWEALSLNLFLSIDVSNRMIIGKYEKEKAVVPPHEGLQLFNSSRIINPRIS